MPQVYAIASERGVEVGFAVSIAEKDYFDVETKERNRAIVPFISSKIPSGTEPISQALAHAIGAQGGWHFNSKTRLIQGNDGFDVFASIGEMFDHLKVEGLATGGGAVCRVFKFEQLADLDLEAEFGQAVSLFAPLLAQCAPTPWDIKIRSAQVAVEDFDEAEAPPMTAEEGRQRVLAEVARRQGQASFRRKLLGAYNGTCAITGTDVSDVLQAAHIRPYNGPSTNHVTNGLLLRADLHTLFDLKLIAINPKSMCLTVSPRLQGTIYWELNGREITRPNKTSMHPNVQALSDHFRVATSGDGTD
ncbi:MAG: HNH endonuclease [Dehalococcoidia bacterium]